MSSEISEEQRLLIEAKRKKALDCRNRNKPQSLTIPSSIPVKPATSVRQTLAPQLNDSDNNKSSTVAQEFLRSAQLWVKRSSEPTFAQQLPKHQPVKLPCLPVVNKSGQNQLSKSTSIALGNKGLSVPSNFPSVDQLKKRMTVTCVLVSNTRFEVHSRYHPGLNEVFKAMSSKLYDLSSKKWSFNLSEYHDFVKKVNMLGEFQLEGLPFAVQKTFRPYFAANPTESKSSKKDQKTLLEMVPKEIVKDLFPFQKEGVCIALSRSGRILWADDMGLGKTVQSLAVAAAYRSEWPLLIVSPSSVRFTWRDQLIRWLGEPLGLNLGNIAVITTGRDLEQVTDYRSSAPVTIISYDLLSRYGKDLIRRHFGCVIMDESHFLKNIKAARTKAAMPILKEARRVLLLSGTPAMSRPAELFPQIAAVSPNLFRGGFHEFGLRYCAAKECPWGWDYSGCSNMSELQLILEHSVMIRRIKSDVLDQLPPKRRELVILDPSLIKKGRLDRHAKNMMMASKLSGAEKRTAMFQYFHETGSVKLPAVQQYIMDLIEADRKFILYAHHCEVMDALANLLTEKDVKFIRIDGRTNSEQRAVVCQKFQREELCRVALLSITAAGTGLNLTAANLVVFAELYWNPGALVQAEDRAYRIGQQDSVIIRYLFAEQTADDYIWPLVERKLSVLSKAGLNRETFRTADATRLGSSSDEQQQSILSYFTQELNIDDTTDLELSEAAELLENMEPQCSQVFEPKPQTSTEPKPKKPKLANLFDSNDEDDSSRPLSSNSGISGSLLVPASPESSPTGHKQSGSVDKSADHPETSVEVLDCSDDHFKSEDSMLVEAAMAAEVAWLTDGLMTEVGEFE